MHVDILGVGNAFSGPVSTSLIVDLNGKSILVDAGYGVYEVLKENDYLEEIDTIFISHTHEDHIASLGAILNDLRYIKKIKLPRIVAHEQVARMLESYLRVIGFPDIQVYTCFMPFVKAHHTIPCYGIVIRDNEKDEAIIYTGDTKCSKEIYDVWYKYRKRYDVTIYHDCQIMNIDPPNGLASPHATWKEIALAYPDEMLECIRGVHHGMGGDIVKPFRLAQPTI